MSEFMLGVFTAMAIWHGLNILAVLTRMGDTIRYTPVHLAGYIIFTLISLVGVVWFL